MNQEQILDSSKNQNYEIVWLDAHEPNELKKY